MIIFEKSTSNESDTLLFIEIMLIVPLLLIIFIESSQTLLLDEIDVKLNSTS